MFMEDRIYHRDTEDTEATRKREKNRTQGH